MVIVVISQTNKYLYKHFLAFFYYIDLRTITLNLLLGLKVQQKYVNIQDVFRARKKSMTTAKTAKCRKKLLLFAKTLQKFSIAALHKTSSIMFCQIKMMIATRSKISNGIFKMPLIDFWEEKFSTRNHYESYHTRGFYVEFFTTRYYTHRKSSFQRNDILYIRKSCFGGKWFFQLERQKYFSQYNYLKSKYILYLSKSLSFNNSIFLSVFMISFPKSSKILCGFFRVKKHQLFI